MIINDVHAPYLDFNRLYAWLFLSPGNIHKLLKNFVLLNIKLFVNMELKCNKWYNNVKILFENIFE